MTIRFPYELQEGQIAYARHVMADLRAIVKAVDNLEVAGFTTSDVASMLGELMARKVEKGEVGNADDIKFADGETMQEKLDGGEFYGRDGTIYDGYAYFHLDGSGNLSVSVTTDNNPYSIDNSGALILTVDDTEHQTIQTYDLGNVKGPKGDDGERGADGETSSNTTADIAAEDWINKVAEVSAEGITADNNFIVQPHLSGVTEDDDLICAAWDAAKIRVVSQSAGTFTLYARGDAPEIDITVDIIYNI